jgi:hypothetical protein
MIRAAILAAMLAVTGPSTPEADIHVWNYGDHNPNCPAWSDGCVACSRRPDGGQWCNNPGIACRPDPEVTCSW